MAFQPNIDPPATRASARLQQRVSDSFTVTQHGNQKPGSAEWWRTRLLNELYSRKVRYDVYEAYYDGQHRLAFATEKFRETFGMLFSAFADNWCDLVVDASVERLHVEGFRFGARGGRRLMPTSASFDTKAWDIWQANGLDAESGLAHTEAVKLGEAYLLVTPSDATGELPIIQVEHPCCAVVACNPARPRERLAGLRLFCDDIEGVELAVLYLPGEVYWWARPLSARGTRSGGWEPYRDPTGGRRATGRNPLGVVPLIPMQNRARLRDRCGTSDLARVIPMQDAINKLVTDMIVASEFAAYRQRWAAGLEIPRDPQTGRPLPGFEPGANRLWAVADPNVKWGEFQASDLSNYVTAVEALIQHVAAQTRTPPHYLLGSSGNFPSGESLKATETGLVAKVLRKQVPFGESWEEALRIAFAILGDPRADAQDAETIWRNPESRSEAEITDAAVKRSTIGVPEEALWAYMGASPQEIEDWSKLKAAKAAQAPPAAPPPPPGDPAAAPNGPRDAAAQPGDPAQTPPPVAAR